jgi:hypothetical protein
MDFPYWNPVSFYEHMGYSRADKDGMVILVWKPFHEDATPPRFLHRTQRPPGGGEKLSATMFLNGWCTGMCSECVTARDAVAGLEDFIDYQEVDTSDRDTMVSWGISSGLYVEGEPFRPYEPPCTSDELRKMLLDLAQKQRQGR